MYLPKTSKNDTNIEILMTSIAILPKYNKDIMRESIHATTCNMNMSMEYIPNMHATNKEINEGVEFRISLREKNEKPYGKK